MKITSIRVRLFPNTGNKVVGAASINLDDMIALHNIRILKTEDHLFLAMPSKPVGVGTFKDIVHPINSSVRSSIENLIFGSYNYCIENNYISMQLDLIEDSQTDSLLDQDLDDFQIVYIKDHYGDKNN